MVSPWIATVVLVGFVGGGASSVDDRKLKLSECPEAVRTALHAEAAGARIEVVTRQKEEDDDAVFWAEVMIGGKAYAIGVLEDGTLSEISLAVGSDEEIAFDRCPAAAQATFKAEAFGQAVPSVSRDLKYGVAIYEAVVDHQGKSYEIVVAEDGTLVEKVLVIDDEDIELAACPAPVQAALKKHAQGGTLEGITRTNGIGKHIYEAELSIKAKVYLIEVDEAGSLISKTLQAAEE